MIACDRCGAKRHAKLSKDGSPKLPRGWKRKGEVAYCSSCWREGHVLRAITFPIAGPVGFEWSELREMLRDRWNMTTALSNWAMRQLYLADEHRMPESPDKMPKFDSPYLYPAAREQFPDLEPMAVVSILQAVERRYRESRYEIVWTSGASLPTYRYPTPWPLHNAAWKPILGDDREALISVRLAGERRALRLRGGKGFARQRRAFLQMVNGEAVTGELAIYRQRAHTNDNRPSITEREPGGGPKVQTRVMAKLVAWLPRVTQVRGTDTLFLRTDPDGFFVATTPNGREWRLHGEHVRQWCAEHRRHLNQMSDDQKFERRWPAAKRRQMNEHRRQKVTKHRRRIDTWIHQSVAWAVGFARRQKSIGTIVYDDTARPGYAFEWYRLQQALGIKCHEVGVEMVGASAPVVSEA